MVFQQYNLWPHLTVMENLIEAPVKVLGISKEAAIEKGAYDFYQKPVDIDALGLIVRRALHLSRIEAENRNLATRASSESSRARRFRRCLPIRPT
jgi:ABC-type arginine transport system ATPase subunit